MMVQFVQFESKLPEDKLLAAAERRMPDYRAIPSLVQKYYLKLSAPNHYGGLLFWDTPAAMAAFRNSELAKTVSDVYQTVGAPRVDIHELMFPLR
ncbi:MAG: hypothetical protein KDK07_16115 [Bauldia sp.]|nr:hypothetical protein [Bauldia sp.]